MKRRHYHRRRRVTALAAALLLLPGCHGTTDSVLNTILLAFEIVEVWF